MTSLRDYFGQIYRFNEDKDAIITSTDIAAIAAILRDAQERDRASNTNSASDSEDGLYTSYVAKLQQHAQEQAVFIGLDQMGIYVMREKMERLQNRLDSTIATAGLELYSDSAELNSIGAMLVHDAHRKVKRFIAALGDAPAALFSAAPALAVLRDGSGAPRIWEADSVTTTYSRADIRDAFIALRTDLASIAATLDAAAITHLRSKDSASMAVIAPLAPPAPPAAQQQPKP